jgi:hypothetical protein
MYLTRAYLAPLLMLLPALALLRRRRLAATLTRHPLLATALLAAAANLAARGAVACVTKSNAFYLRDFYLELPLLAGAAGALVRAWQAASAPALRRWLALQAVAAVLLSPLVWGLPNTVRLQGPPALTGITAAGRFLAAHTAPTDRIFALEDPHIFLAAGRQLLPLLTHHLFMYRPAAPAGALVGTFCFNRPMLLNLLRHEATVVVWTQRGMEWVAHNERTGEGQEILAAVYRELKTHWHVVAEASNSFAGLIRIYRPGAAQAPKKTATSAPSAPTP